MIGDRGSEESGGEKYILMIAEHQHSSVPKIKASLVLFTVNGRNCSGFFFKVTSVWVIVTITNVVAGELLNVLN